MSEMKHHRIDGHEGVGTLDLSPYGDETAWLEVSNSEYSGFLVMTPGIALELSAKLAEWASNNLPNIKE